jgi:cell wall-associated NlpC family hydrolase
MSRFLTLAACSALLAAPSALGVRAPEPAPAKSRAPQGGAAASWAQADIRFVVAHGLMAKTAAAFRPTDALTQGELETLVAGLTKQVPAVPANPAAPVTVAQLDARLVKVLGLTGAAKALGDGARAAGLATPSRFGTEAVARLLGLRTNHPTKQDALELAPSDPVTRAETAYSVARILRFRGWEVDSVEEAVTTFELPQLTAWQKRLLNTTVRFIGFPYVWGGTSESPQSLFGAEVPGGFDCSGFVWRVFKLQAYPGGTGLAQTIRGRTTYDMSGEVPKSKRIGFAKLAPGDLLFFGPSGPASKPASIGHAGVYLGGGWMIHSSGQGVAVTPLTGWYRQQFAWARRPLAEAGLSGTR